MTLKTLARTIPVAWALPLAIAFGALSYSFAIYYAEKEKQETARMKVCIDSGGEWITAWNWRAYCKSRSTAHNQ